MYACTFSAAEGNDGPEPRILGALGVVPEVAGPRVRRQGRHPPGPISGRRTGRPDRTGSASSGRAPPMPRSTSGPRRCVTRRRNCWPVGPRGRSSEPPGTRHCRFWPSDASSSPTRSNGSAPCSASSASTRKTSQPERWARAADISPPFRIRHANCAGRQDRARGLRQDQDRARGLRQDAATRPPPPSGTSAGDHLRPRTAGRGSDRNTTHGRN